MVKSANGIPSDNPSCILLGNGINLLFNDPSWKKLIQDELNESHSPLTYEEIEGMPATMQIVVATGDTVDSKMKRLSEKLLDLNMTQERIAFLQRILSLPVEDILTANYSFELEAADGMKLNKRQYSTRLQNTFELQHRHKAFRLYQYYETARNKRIWHVHGDIAKPDTMLMGHYYYAKQLKDVQDCVRYTIRRVKRCEKTGEEYRAYSWADQFLTGNVYILGLGMYLCESDLWYLLCSKKRHFSETKTYFYDMKCSDQTVNMMLKTYGVEIIDSKMLGAPEVYKDFYDAALTDIEKRIKG